MRHLIISLAILFSPSAIFAQRSEGQSFAEYYTEKDKLLHMGSGFIIGGAGAKIYATYRPDEPLINAWAVGFLSGSFVGGAKEILIDDIMGLGTPDHGDFMATATASAVGSLVEVGFIKWQRKRFAKKHSRIAANPMTGDKVVLR